MEKYVAGVGDDTDLVFVVSTSNFCTKNTLCWETCNLSDLSLKKKNQVGAMSHGKIECDYVDDFISGKLFLDPFLYNHLMQK